MNVGLLFFSVYHTFYAVQASIPSNTYVVSGVSVDRRIEQLLPGIMPQLGREGMEYVRMYAEAMKASVAAAGAGAGASSAPGIETLEEGEEGEEEEDEDEVPALVENFEEAANK